MLVITALTTFNGTLWVVGGAIVFSLMIPPLTYIEVRAKHKFMVKAIVFAVFSFINVFVVIFFGQQWTPYPLYSLALFEYFVTLIFVMSLVGLLSERYLKPKLETN